MKYTPQSAEHNQDLFGFEDITAEEIDRMVSEEEKVRWPEDMRHMYDLLAKDLETAGFDKSLAITQLNSICKAFGGMQFYLPRGDALKLMIIRFNIWNEFTGNNVRELALKHHVTEQHIYRTVRTMRARESKRRQHDLF
ncbi:Mor transcription activator family protein [Aliivibrio wodanis]|uniref:Mor transcription activator family protein n=1 Tax=Aliivibrio wodanis TaxID=80852 RepID=UPI00406CF3E4